MTSQVAISNLDAEHLIPLQRSLQQIFSTKLAEVTLAQVVDGIPTEQIDTQYMSGCDEVISGRTKPTDEAFEELARWRSTFQLEDLMIGSDPPYKCREPEYIEPFPIPQIPGFEDPEPPRPVLLPEKPTYLYHVNYVVHEQYPMGVADMVGYWVEYRVLGGVVLFDRGESENEVGNRLRVLQFEVFQLLSHYTLACHT
ncbi:hypothetical protein N7456_000395 [Penicillium angulare]|uniref:Uncharacterized protein n=1 Tax=Penicillium angulare TaxID=116970 RepID=A0A9W9GCF0_9EURO|nr:hypothetical protein N7456_000395 [Penicillium angulare]